MQKSVGQEDITFRVSDVAMKDEDLILADSKAELSDDKKQMNYYMRTRTVPHGTAVHNSILEVCSDSLNTRSEDKKNSGRSES